MNLRRSLIAIVTLVLLLTLIAWMAGLFAPKVDSTLITSQDTAVVDTELHVVTLVMTAITESVPASTVARDDTVIASRILARVNEVKVRPGDVAEKGQLLIQLEQADLISRVNQAQDRIDSISAQLEDAKLRLDRTAELRSKGLAAPAEEDTARSTFDSLAAQLAQMREALEEAEIILRFSEIRAPINGKIVERLVEPGDTTSPGMPLMTLYDPLSIRVEARVREALALKLSLGQEIDIEIASINQHLRGVIEEVVPAAHTASRSFLVKASIAYHPGLVPGMFARFIIPVESKSLLKIPLKYVTEVGQLNIVYVYADSELERRYVRLGPHEDGLTVVLSGLNEGDRLSIPAPKNP